MHSCGEVLALEVRRMRAEPCMQVTFGIFKVLAVNSLLSAVKQVSGIRLAWDG